LRILSLNLCASWTSPRKDRLRAVADFVKLHGVDVLLLQEGIRSCFAYDTIRQLAGLLGYDHFSKSTFGYPFFWEFRVGVVSRFKILRTDSLACEVPQTDLIDSIPLPWRRRAVAASLYAPGLGITTAISVHLTSNPETGGGRVEQLKKVRDWKNSLPARDVTIIGGDWNTTFPRDGETMFGQAPDYIFVEGANLTRGEQVFTDHVVSDHVGIMVEVERA
jgi:endonuclease/exonuclease/phosphatase family metal-dependent hydrolase